MVSNSGSFLSKTANHLAIEKAANPGIMSATTIRVSKSDGNARRIPPVNCRLANGH